MKSVYEVLRQKELEVSRLQKEVEALRVAAPFLLADGEVEDDRPTLPRAVNYTAQPDHSGWQERGKKQWGLRSDLDKKALEAVSKWRFSPAIKDGKPIAASLNVQVAFRLY